MLELKQWCQARGWAVAWGPFSLLGDVRSRLARLSSAGELDRQFVKRELNSFNYPQAGHNGGGSVLIVAVPRPAHEIGFELDNGRLTVLAPPTYVDYSRLPSQVRELLLAEVFPPETRLEPLAVPLKTLAARLGLVQYGLNNITYATGLGSYFQLVGYLTDANLPLPAGWQASEPRLMPECEECGLCSRVCPTGAIGSERVLLHAEDCLTLFSENAGDFPRDMLPSGYRCLVGCLECQQTCPQNAGMLRVEATAVVFDREEAEALLGQSPLEVPLANTIRAKLETLAMAHYLPVLARNLKNLVALRQAIRTTEPQP